MDWIDLFLSRDQRQDRRIEELTEALGSGGVGKSRFQENRVSDLQKDVGLLILLQLVTMRTLIEKGLMSPADLHAKMMEIDKLDGLGDGKVDSGALRRILGLWISGAEEGQGPSSAKD